MKPIGGIVTNSKSNPENFRQVETFTTEYLSKLWKIYTINRDVLDKGRRLENLFWRIWGSERIQRTFSGKTVSAIFLLILEGEDRFERIGHRIPGMRLDEVESTPQPSLDIECPPTPPPSPVPSMTLTRGFQVGSSYLAKLPSQMALAASLHQAFPPRPPSPPRPSQAGPSSPATTATAGISLMSSPSRPASSPLALSSPSKQPCGSIPITIPNPSPTLETEPLSSDEGSDHQSLPIKGKRTRFERPPRGRRKPKPAAHFRVAPAARRPRPAVPRRKSASAASPHADASASSPPQPTPSGVARSLPSVGARRDKPTPEYNDSAAGKLPSSHAATAGWVVDPDFRTKYLQRKRQEKLAALISAVPSAMPAVATIQNLSTGVLTNGKGKNARVITVDGVVPLKGPAEEEVAGMSIVAAAVTDEDIDCLPMTLMRRKSELTLLFEEEKKGKESSGSKKTGD